MVAAMAPGLVGSEQHAARAAAGLILEIEIPSACPDRVPDDECRASISICQGGGVSTPPRPGAKAVAQAAGVALVTRSVRLGNPCQATGLIFSLGLVRVV